MQRDANTPPAQSRDDERDQYGLTKRDRELRLWFAGGPDDDDEIDRDSADFRRVDSAYRAEIDRLRGQLHEERRGRIETAVVGHFSDVRAMIDEATAALRSENARLRSALKGIEFCSVMDVDDLEDEDAAEDAERGGFATVATCPECGGIEPSHHRECAIASALAPAASATETEERTNAK